MGDQIRKKEIWNIIKLLSRTLLEQKSCNVELNKSCLEIWNSYRYGS